MESATQLPPELAALVASGRLRRIDDTEYAIDAFSHREMSWSGWRDVWYSLRIGEYEEFNYEIVEESRDDTDDSMLLTSDPDEVAAWIEERLDSDD